jgi:hypothetical protein
MYKCLLEKTKLSTKKFNQMVNLIDSLKIFVAIVENKQNYRPVFPVLARLKGVLRLMPPTKCN